MATIGKEDLKRAIASAVRERSAVYHGSFALSIHWERDDTKARLDVDHFQAILSTLNLPKAEVLSLSSKDKTPGWTFGGKLGSLFRAAGKSDGRTIAFIHYVGHGMVVNDNLFVTETPNGRKFNLDSYISQTVDDICLPGAENTDVVWILDCCYAHKGHRAVETSGRIVEIISATSETTPFALFSPSITLTRKLRTEIAKRKENGHQTMEIAEVVQSLRDNNPKVCPSHSLKKGVSSVRLSLGGVSTITRRTTEPFLRVVFTVRIAESMSRDDSEAFLRWIQSLHSDHAITLDAIYEANSTLLILQSAQAFYSKLAGIQGINIVSEVSSVNRRPLLDQQKQQQPLSPSTKPLKENIRSPKGFKE